MSEPIQSAPDQPETRFQCRHMRASGRRCGIAALRGDIFCYYHIASRRGARRPPNKFEDPSLQPFGLPIIEDRASIQLALSHIITRIASNELDTKRAGKLLYALQLASSNLTPAIVTRPRTTNDVPTATEPETPMQDPVIDKVFGILAPIAIFHPVPNPQPTSLPSLKAAIDTGTERNRESHARLSLDQRPHRRNAPAKAAVIPPVAAIEATPAHVSDTSKIFVHHRDLQSPPRPVARIQTLLHHIFSAPPSRNSAAVPIDPRESITPAPHLPY